MGGDLGDKTGGFCLETDRLSRACEELIMVLSTETVLKYI